MGSSRPGVPISRQPLLNTNRCDEKNVKKAAWQLEDALGRGELVDAYPSTSHARETYFKVAHARSDFRWAMLVMVILTLFETPAWCNNEEKFFEFMPAHSRCIPYKDGDPHDPHNITWNFTYEGIDKTFDTILLSDVPYIPPGIGLILQAYLMCVAARKFLLERKLQVRYFSPLKARYIDLNVVTFGLIMVLLELADSVWFVVQRPKWRLAFLARTGLLCTLPGVRSLMNCILTVVKSFGSVLFMLLISLVFFAWISVTLFDDVTGETYWGKNVTSGMESYGDTFYTMFVAGNTDEFVDVLLPTYSTIRMSGLLWLFFLFLVQVLFLNMVLDTLVANYMDTSEENVEKENYSKVKGIDKAFHALVDGSSTTQHRDYRLCTISKADFLDLVREFSLSPGSHSISKEAANYLYRAVKTETQIKTESQTHHSGVAINDEINREEFVNICALMSCECWTTKRNSPVKDVFPSIWKKSKWLRNKVTNGDASGEQSSFDVFMDVVLVTNLCMVLLETSYELQDKTKPAVLGSLELIFSFAYVMEVGMKLCVYSWAEYCSNASNLFDFATTWLLLASSLVEEVMKDVQFKAKRYMNILRLLRLVRVIKQLKRYESVQFMIKTIGKLIASSADIISLLGVVVFFFTCLSVQLWGGLIHYKNEKLDETEYKEANWLVLNFNDSFTAFGSWVVMLLCEYVPKYAEAVYAVSDYKKTWLIFPIFYICGVCIVFELVKAYTIEKYIEYQDERKKELQHAQEHAQEHEDSGHDHGHKSKHPSHFKEKLQCFCCSLDADEEDEGEKVERFKDKEFQGLQAVQKELSDQGLCFHYSVGDAKERRDFKKAFNEIEEEEQEEQEEEESS